MILPHTEHIDAKSARALKDIHVACVADHWDAG